MCCLFWLSSSVAVGMPPHPCLFGLPPDKSHETSARAGLHLLVTLVVCTLLRSLRCHVVLVGVQTSPLLFWLSHRSALSHLPHIGLLPVRTPLSALSFCFCSAFSTIVWFLPHRSSTSVCPHTGAVQGALFCEPVNRPRCLARRRWARRQLPSCA